MLCDDCVLEGMLNADIELSVAERVVVRGKYEVEFEGALVVNAAVVEVVEKGVDEAVLVIVMFRSTFIPTL